MAVRTLERTLEEVLLPALDLASSRPGDDFALEYSCRWSSGWLHGARRLSPPASRDEGILLLDSGPALSLEAVHAQALELCLRRAGFRVLLLSAELAERRFGAALRALQPSAVVLCGSDARLDVLGDPLRKAMGTGRTRPFSYRSAQLVSGSQGISQLGDVPSEAVARLMHSLGLL